MAIDPIPSAAPAPAATAPAPAVDASPAATGPAKVGFLSRLTGAAATISALETALATERAALESATAELVTLRAKLADYADLEAQLEQQLAAHAAASQAAAEAAAAATAAAQDAAAQAAATVPAAVAAGVADVCASLGVAETTLPAVQADPPPADHSHLTGRARVAAAFAAQFNK